MSHWYEAKNRSMFYCSLLYQVENVGNFHPHNIFIARRNGLPLERHFLVCTVLDETLKKTINPISNRAPMAGLRNLSIFHLPALNCASDASHR